MCVLTSIGTESALGPILANIIMTECEKLVIDDLIKTGIIQFYIRYVDDSRENTRESALSIKL